MPTPSRLPSLLRLLRWLGPWTAETAAPDGVRCESWRLRDGEVRGKRGFDAAMASGRPFRPTLTPGAISRLDANVYETDRAVGLIVLSPGLHFDGPDDPRMDRFCRVLANAGLTVVAPFIPTYVDMRAAPSAIDDLELVTREAMKRFASLGTPTLFSISFGSWPAIEVAARLGSAIDSIITFGGYSDFAKVASFNLDGVMPGPDGPVTLPFDRLNAPAVFINIVRFLRPASDNDAIELAWRRLCYTTWGRFELKDPALLAPFVDEEAARVPAEDRELFRIGAGISPEGIDLLRRGIEIGKEELAALNPDRAIPHLTCPVVVCHGRDDDVIPWGQAVELAKACEAHVPTRLHLTGLYAHTGHGRPRPSELAGEVWTMLAIVRAISGAGRLRSRLSR